jgi:ribosome-associated heat shock protein Hsp15
MPGTEKIRLDKWLWAARFFKTRSLAAQAIDGGKVRYDGERPKPAREVHLGGLLRVTLPSSEREVVIKGLSAQRRPASEACLLYEETGESRRRNEEERERRQAEFGERERGHGRPTKRDRRQIHRFFS